MKANELRIGNYILHEPTIDDWEEIIVTPLSLLQVDISPESYCGIPLTEEWLLKFGFDKVANDCWMISKSGQATYIDLIQGEFYYYLEVNTETSIIVKHVHQLQNLYFALTGQELTIKE